MRPRLAAGWLLLLGALAIAGSAAAETTLPGGTLTGDTTWDLAGSPYIIDGDIVVPAGVTLTIEAGVEVGWNWTNAIIVEGGLVINGTSTSPVYIYETGMSFYPHWVGIQFVNHTIDSFIKNTTLQGAITAIDVKGPRASLLVEDVFIVPLYGFGTVSFSVDGAANNVAVHGLDITPSADGIILSNSTGIVLSDIAHSNWVTSVGNALAAYDVSNSVLDGADFQSGYLLLVEVEDFTVLHLTASDGSTLGTVRILDSSDVTIEYATVEGPLAFQFDRVTGLLLNDSDTTGMAVWGTNSSGVRIERLNSVDGPALKMENVSGLVAMGITATGSKATVQFTDCPGFVLDGATLSGAGQEPVVITGASGGGRVSNATLDSFNRNLGFYVESPYSERDLDFSRGNLIAGLPVLGIYRQPGTLVSNASNYAWIYVYGSPNVTVLGARLVTKPQSHPAAVWADSPNGRLEDWTVAARNGPHLGLVVSYSSRTVLERVHASSGSLPFYSFETQGLRVANSSFVGSGVSTFYVWNGRGSDLYNITTASGVTSIHGNDTRVSGSSFLSGATFYGDGALVMSSSFCGVVALKLQNLSNGHFSNLSFCASSSSSLVMYGTSAVTLENSTFNGTTLAITIGTDAKATVRWNMFTRCTNTGVTIASDAAAGNEVYDNRFACAWRNARDTSQVTQYWYNATTQRGNWWDDYTGVDDDHDGVGDTPHPIAGWYKEDLYPLIAPFDGVPPVAVAFPPATVDEDVPFQFDGSGSSDNLGFLSGWWVVDLPSGPVNVSGLVATYVFATPGSYNVTLFVSDGWNEASARTHVTVRDITPPQLTAPAEPVEADEDVLIDLAIGANDNDPRFPAAATFEWSVTGRESQQWSSNGASTSLTLHEPGTYNVEAAVTDAAGNLAIVQFTLSVRDTTAPVCSASTAGTPGIGGVVTVEMATATDNDPAFPGPGAYHWRIGTPDATTLEGNGTTFTFASPRSGVYSVVYTCTDPTGNAGGGTLPVIVADRDGPAWNPPPPFVVGDGDEHSLSAESATDVSGVAGAVWKEGTVTLGTDLVLSRVWTGLGDHRVNVTLTDTVGNTANFSVLIRVLDRTAPSLGNVSFTALRHGREGAALTIEVAGAFVDNDPAFASGARYEWDALGPVSSWTAGPGNRSLRVAFSEPGNWSVQVTVIDPAGNFATFTLPITVAPERSTGPGGGGAAGGLPVELIALLAVFVAAGVAGVLIASKRRRPE